MNRTQHIKQMLSRLRPGALPQVPSHSPNNATALSSRKYVPPLLLETRPSKLHALIGLSLHLLALVATFSSTAHTLHFFFNRHSYSADESAHTATLLTSIGFCLVATCVLSVMVLISAIATWRDANKRIRLNWHSDNTVAITPIEPKGSLIELPSPVYLPVQGGYNNHFCLVLALRAVSSQRPAGKIRRLVLARDAMDDDAFRLLRVWMQLESYRSTGTADVDQVQ